MKKTILCHFYNEEWLLPWWLEHHKQIFDHGILFDYDSTDRSVEIIKEICPTWEIVRSRNKLFQPAPVDHEVMEFEKSITGWRVALNVTEFMIGNYDHLDDTTNSVQYFLSQYMITDMERRDEPYFLDPTKPIWEQRRYGYAPVNDFSRNQSHGSVPRAPRSIHNHVIKYASVGRHYPGKEQSFNDLTIFYCGNASMEEGSIKRKMQIQEKCPPGPYTNHRMELKQLLDRFRSEQQQLSYDVSGELKPYIDAHNSWLARKHSAETNKTKEEIQSAMEALQTALANIK